MKKNFLILFILLITSVSTYALGSSESIEKNYKKTLQSKIELFNLMDNFVKNNPNSPDIDKLYFKLAELSNEINVKDPGKTLSLYKKVLEKNPEFPYRDVVLYNIGFYNFEYQILLRDKKRIRNLELSENWPDSLRLSTDDLDLSIKSYNEIIEKFPESKYKQESLYRLGELYFTISLDAVNSVPFYKKSLAYFNLLLQSNKESFYKPYAQFYKAWIEYVSGDNEEAINDFSQLLTLLNKKNDQMLNSLFKAGSLDNFARSLLEYDKDFSSKSIASQKAKEVLKSLLPENYAKEVLLKSISYKLEYNAPQQAIDFYNTYISMFPSSINCPTYIDSIINIYKNYANFFDGANLVKNKIISEWNRTINDYTVESEWYKVNKEKDISAQLNFIKSSYFEMEKRYYNRAVTDLTMNSLDDYKKLMTNFIAFPEFRDDEKNKDYIFKIKQRYADLYYTNVVKRKDFSLYTKVIENYNNLNNEYPKNINFYENETKKYQVAQDLYVNSELENSGIKNYVNTDSLIIVASERYEKVITDTLYKDKYSKKDHINLLLTRARILFKLEKYNKAKDVYSQIIALNPDLNVKKEALTTLAQINYINKDFDKAEELYSESYNLASDAEKTKYLNNKYAVIEAKAKELHNQGLYERSAKEYLRLKDMFINDKLKATGYILDAIEEYKNAKNNTKIIELYSEIAKINSNKAQVLAAYVNAWSIADSLKDYQKSEMLRQSFIKRFPKSKEALQAKLDIINIYEKDKNDLKYAAEQYYSIYKNRKKYNFGKILPKSILLKSIQLYTKLGDEPNQIKLSLLYAKKYPNDKLSDKMLLTVAGIYQKNNEMDKLNSLAVYMYKKNPKLNIYVDLAKKKLADNLEKSAKAYSERNEQLVRKLKKEYSAMVATYRKNGINNLPYNVGFIQYSDYLKTFAYLNKVDKEIANVQKNFLNKPPKLLIAVNKLTKLNDHLLKGKSRIPRLNRRAKKISNKLFKLITDSKDIDLDNERRIKLLYFAGKVNEYASDVIMIQIDKYLQYSTDPDLKRYKSDKVTFNKVKKIIRNKAKRYSFDNKKEAAKYYQTLVTNFYDELQISNIYTEKALKKLEEWKVRTPLKIIDVPIDDTWFVYEDNKDVNINDIVDSNLWKPALIEKVANDSTLAILLKGESLAYIKKDFDFTVIPKEIRIETKSEIKNIFVNGYKMEIKNSHFGEIYVISKYLVEGKNKIIMDIPFTKKLVMSVNVRYDADLYAKYKDTEKIDFITDFSWRYSYKNYGSNEINIDSLAFANKDNFSFYKSQIIGFKNNKAMGIWKDSKNVAAGQDTVYFYKVINIDSDVIESNAILVVERFGTIWVNDKKILDSKEIEFTKLTNEVQPYSLKELGLGKGKNLIKIGVVPNKNGRGGLIMSISAKIKKKSNGEN